MSGVLTGRGSPAIVDHMARDERKWERGLSMLARPRRVLGPLTVGAAIVLAIVAFVHRTGFAPGMVLLLIVAFLAARGTSHDRFGRGVIYLAASWALLLVAYGALFGQIS